MDNKKKADQIIDALNRCNAALPDSYAVVVESVLRAQDMVSQPATPAPAGAVTFTEIEIGAWHGYLCSVGRDAEGPYYHARDVAALVAALKLGMLVMMIPAVRDIDNQAIRDFDQQLRAALAQFETGQR